MLGNIADFFSSGANVMFFVFALLAIGGAIFMISFTKVVSMVVSAAVTFLSLAGLYVLLEAEFLAMAQVLVYAGGISILMIFGIVMTRHKGEEPEDKRRWHHIGLWIGIAGLFGILFYAFQNVSFPKGELATPEDNTLEIGKRLFTEQVIPFELMSILLTVAFIGAIILAKREEE
ncbi:MULTISPECIES: NADH-quinone oxidoreductase subunit J [Paenibacillus]|jgi:NADH-quinone oxidoreductase subunit J|uniref:NADH-quinone oxidoreductase subunit J n=1 Tax=Paenibacillus oceani TaxID=2772510 RepID=A0A927H0S5_9BACL|nr:NADH-quinone oxidoreductase subunit J [Paenibacillus oceani]MBD2863598.1 NADH-quinone oxidoreductase subunit J [Paenibacillus oceani]MDF2659579.1 subunit of NADH:ubiquinone oxidoreductase [Paenibacillus sp.]